LTNQSMPHSSQNQVIGWKWRALTFAGVTSIVLAIMDTYDQAGLRTKLYPPPSFLGSTWYGPLLLLLIPLSLFWLSLGMKSRTTKMMGVGVAVLVLLFCFLEIYVCMSAVGSLPSGIPPYGGRVRSFPAGRRIPSNFPGPTLPGLRLERPQFARRHQRSMWSRQTRWSLR
jgi:hypothetical protein